LLLQDFVEIQEKDDWADVIQPGGRYFVRRQGSSGNSIIAFAIGKKWRPGSPFSIVASHVDSPCLKIKPLSDRTTAGFRGVGVEIYGGGLWHTWFDRDLGAAGRVFVRTASTTIESVLIQLDEPILRVPCIASHYEHQNPFKFDTETHLLPIASQQSQEPTEEERKSKPMYEQEIQYSENRYIITPANKRHPDLIVEKIAEKLNTHPDNIIDFDLSLYDLQKATLGGLNNEFVYSARIDNLMMTFCALKGFLGSLSQPESLDDEPSVRTFVAFDNEEIGSTGPLSAQSTFLPSIIERLAGSKERQSIARSLLISADVIHGTHPNYHGYHDVTHKPVLNGGIVFSSTSRRYLAKSTPSVITLLESICKFTTPDESDPRHAIDNEPPRTQFFVFPNGRDCGSTVGPHLEANLGMRVVDMGNAALSMHSIREMAGSTDVDNAVRFLRLFYENYSYFEERVVLH
jgi:aspartyl aminopeptidase